MQLNHLVLLRSFPIAYRIPYKLNSLEFTLCAQYCRNSTNSGENKNNNVASELKF